MPMSKVVSPTMTVASGAQPASAIAWSSMVGSGFDGASSALCVVTNQSAQP